MVGLSTWKETLAEVLWTPSILMTLLEFDLRENSNLNKSSDTVDATEFLYVLIYQNLTLDSAHFQ